MSKKFRFVAWAVYTLASWFILLAVTDPIKALGIAILIGFFFGLIGEVIHLLIEILEELKK